MAFIITGVGVVLASYTWGRDAQRHTGMSDNDIINECLRSLAKIHGMEFRDVQDLYMKGVVKRWDLDEFAIGAFTLFHPHQVRQHDPAHSTEALFCNIFTLL